MDDLILYDNITDEELQKVFKEIKHNRQRLDYIQRYYTERKNEYEIREFTSSDKKVIGTIEVHKLLCCKLKQGKDKNYEKTVSFEH